MCLAQGFAQFGHAARDMRRSTTAGGSKFNRAIVSGDKFLRREVELRRIAGAGGPRPYLADFRFTDLFPRLVTAQG
jgi:hypothetical protein